LGLLDTSDEEDVGGGDNNIVSGRSESQSEREDDDEGFDPEACHQYLVEDEEMGAEDLEEEECEEGGHDMVMQGALEKS